MSNSSWIPVTEQLPPDGLVVLTKIDDEKGCRNEQKLVLHNRLWWFDDMSMYIYYAPTHWADVSPDIEGKG